MNGLFKDKEHLVRVVMLFVAGFVVFLLARALLVPKDFGVFGHYRAGALEDNRSRPIVFAGRGACEECHADQVTQRKGSKHERVGCESCHGPLAKHAQDPASLKPARPNGRELCLVCHSENVAKPEKFPQIDPKDHGDTGPCTACHKPHHPEIT